jgi:hypothetical protein
LSNNQDADKDHFTHPLTAELSLHRRFSLDSCDRRAALEQSSGSRRNVCFRVTKRSVIKPLLRLILQGFSHYDLRAKRRFGHRLVTSLRARAFAYKRASAIRSRFIHASQDVPTRLRFGLFISHPERSRPLGGTSNPAGATFYPCSHSLVRSGFVLRCGAGVRYVLQGALYALYASTPRQRASYSVVCDARLILALGEYDGSVAEVPARYRGSTQPVHPNTAAGRLLSERTRRRARASRIRRILHT